MGNTENLERRILQRQRELDRATGEVKALLTRANEVRESITDLTEDVADLDRVTALLNSIGEERQLAAQQTIEELVTRGLSMVFDPTLSFHIIQSVKGKSANVDFVVRDTKSDGSYTETGVMDARGGGLVSTIGFLLRVVVMLLTPDTNLLRLFVLDESFSMVSEEYLPPLREFIRELVDQTGIQIILVTHQMEWLESADKTYRFSQVDGRTKVQEIES